jgi:adenosylcobinamide-GDP ribazoletransferase
MNNYGHIGSESRVVDELRLMLAAVQYFTRLPVPSWVGHSADQLQGTARYFSLVGVLVGGVGALTFWATASILPAPLPAILSTAATVLLTGALHEDGLVDTFDGLGGGATRERALVIMKDPRIGTFGMIALVLTLLLKIAALNAIPAAIVPFVLIAGHAFSRACAISLLFVSTYVGSPEQSRAQPVARTMGNGEFFLATVIGMIPLLGCGIYGFVAGLFAIPVWLTLARWFMRRLGGFTGDTLGATQQLTEIAFYLGVLASWKSM